MSIADCQSVKFSETSETRLLHQHASTRCGKGVFSLLFLVISSGHALRLDCIDCPRASTALAPPHVCFVSMRDCTIVPSRLKSPSIPSLLLTPTPTPSFSSSGNLPPCFDFPTSPQYSSTSPNIILPYPLHQHRTSLQTLTDNKALLCQEYLSNSLAHS